MALELSLRSAIVFLLLSSTAIGGCDKQSQPAQQANESVAANVTAPDPGAAGIDRSHKGEAAPAAQFLDPAGKKVSIASFAGKPVLLNLWATWCIPCVREMPMLDTLASEKGDALTVLTVSQDMDGKKLVAPFFAKHAFKAIKPYLDPDTGLSVALGANLPTTILYDAGGKEVWRVSGDLDWTSATAKALVAEAG